MASALAIGGPFGGQLTRCWRPMTLPVFSCQKRFGPLHPPLPEPAPVGPIPLAGFATGAGSAFSFVRSPNCGGQAQQLKLYDGPVRCRKCLMRSGFESPMGRRWSGQRLGRSQRRRERFLMSGDGVPASCRELDLAAVEEMLVKSRCNIARAAKALRVPASDLRRLVSWGPLAAAASERVEQAIDEAEAVLVAGLRSPDFTERLRLCRRYWR
jgi:hypothetical protein